MKIVYEEGWDMVSLGEAGIFIRGEAKEVSDEIAEKLLVKESIKFKVVKDKKEKEVDK